MTFLPSILARRPAVCRTGIGIVVCAALGYGIARIRAFTATALAVSGGVVVSVLWRDREAWVKRAKAKEALYAKLLEAVRHGELRPDWEHGNRRRTTADRLVYGQAWKEQ